MAKNDDHSREKLDFSQFNQEVLRWDGGEHSVELIPFAMVKIHHARALTAAARVVPECVLRDFGEKRIGLYQNNMIRTYSRVVSLSNVPNLEAYMIVNASGDNDNSAIGVATIGAARAIPLDGTLMDTVRKEFGTGPEDQPREGVVGTFWYGLPAEHEPPEVSLRKIGHQVAGLLVPRMVKIARDTQTRAFSFVASEKSGLPDVSGPMRDFMNPIATGFWEEPVENQQVEYDLLVA